MGASIGSVLPQQGGSPYGQGGSPYGQGGSPNGYRVGSRTMPGYMPGRQGGMPQYGGYQQSYGRGYQPSYGSGYQPSYGGGFGGQRGNPFAGRNLTPQGISFMPRGGGYQQAPAPWRPPQYQPQQPQHQPPQQPQYQPPQGGMSISDQIMSPVSPDITAPKPRTSTNPYVAPSDPAPAGFWAWKGGEYDPLMEDMSPGSAQWMPEGTKLGDGLYRYDPDQKMVKSAGYWQPVKDGIISPSGYYTKQGDNYITNWGEGDYRWDANLGYHVKA